VVISGATPIGKFHALIYTNGASPSNGASTPMPFRGNAGSLRIVAAAVLSAVGCVIACRSMQQPVARLAPADRVLVHKAERRLLLMHDGYVERSYPVHLGLNPGTPIDILP
jgi:hypothetical protein